MYLRFTIAQKDPDSGQPQGVFVAAHALHDSGTLTSDECEQIRDGLSWFNKHLPVPHYSKFGEECIFWLKAEATEVIRRMWQIVNIMRAHDVVVEVWRADRLWCISYRDEYQVAATRSKLDLIRMM